jgi:hypothetical protein
MEVAINDIMISKMNDSINNNEQVIINNLKELKCYKNENKFLNMVYHDYIKHYDTILNEKYKSRAAYRNIFNYLNKLKTNEELTSIKLLEVKNQQNKTLNKLYYIKNEIDDISQL